MTRLRAFGLLVLVVSLLAGCLETPAASVDPQEEEEDGGPGAFTMETRTSTLTFDGAVTDAGVPGSSAADLGRTRFRLPMPQDAVSLEVVLAWDDALVDLDLVVRAPDGRAFTNDAGAPGDGDTPARLHLTEGLLPGEWRLEVRGKNAVQQPFDLTATVEYAVRVPEGAAGAGVAGSDTTRGDVQVERVGDRWRAERSVTYRTDLATADSVRWVAETRNGGIDARADDDGTQSVLTATLYAHGETEEAARARVEAMDVDYRAAVDAGQADLAARAVTTDGGDWRDRGASFVLTTPGGKPLDLEAGATNGPLRILHVEGPSVRATTTNAGVTLEAVTSDELTVDATNGGLELTRVQTRSAHLGTTNAGIRGALVADRLTVDTTNGGVTLELSARQSGEWLVTSTNGGVTVTLPEDAARGYDLVAETTEHMRATVDLEDAEALEDEDHRKHVRTRNYEGRDVQTQATFRTTNANVNVRGA